MGFSTRGFSDDEDIELELHPHWVVFVKPSAAMLLGLILAIASIRITETNEWYETMLRYASLLFAASCSIRLIGRIFAWSTTHFVVTTERVIYQRGLFGRQRLEIPLQRVNNVLFEQNFLERLLNSGDVIVESGADDRYVVFNGTPDPELVQSKIQRAVRVHSRRR